MLFLGNKAFVIDFLRQGLLCCVCLRLTGKDLSGENKYPPPEFRRAYCSILSGVLLLSVNKYMDSSHILVNRKFKTHSLTLAF